jgi:putative alpha-1,2-mannosidase
MSAWYLFTALGFYPVTPASNEYIIGRPFVKRAVLKLPNGRRFTVIAQDLDARHPYVASAELNGAPLRRVFLRHAELMAGGVLRFHMATRPNRDWPGADAPPPYSMSLAQPTAP